MFMYWKLKQIMQVLYNTFLFSIFYSPFLYYFICEVVLFCVVLLIIFKLRDL